MAAYQRMNASELSTRRGAGRDIDWDPAPDLRRQVQDLLLLPADRDLLEQEVQLLEVRGAGRDPAKVILVGVAVALGEGQEGAGRRVPDAAEQVEQVARPVGHGRTGQEKYVLGADHRGAAFLLNPEQLETVAGALAGILNEMRLVQDHSGPWNVVQPGGVLRQQIVIDDDPARSAVGGAVLCADHLHHGIRIDHADFAPPVEL